MIAQVYRLMLSLNVPPCPCNNCEATHESQNRLILKTTAATNGQHTEEDQSELIAIEQQQTRIAKRMETTKLLTQLSGAEAVADDPGELWRWWLDRPRSATRYIVEGASTPLTLTYRASQPSTLQYRLASAGGLLLFVLAAVIGVRRGTLAAWFRGWPGTFGVVIGLAWWLWLSPTRAAPWLIGLALVLGAVKARFILDRVARKIVDRIQERGDGRCLGGFLSLRRPGRTTCPASPHRREPWSEPTPPLLASLVSRAG